MDSPEFKNLLKDKFPFEATQSQEHWLESIVSFLFTKEKQVLYLLKGYAGTGKSTLIGHLVRYLIHANFKSVLMAPTGRAAKVIAGYSYKRLLQFTNKFIIPKRSKVLG